MGTMFDYLDWRGDLPFSDVPFTPVDALIFSTLVYVQFEGIVPSDMLHPVPLHVAADALLNLADAEDRVRVKSDLALLKATAAVPRLRNSRLAFYRSKLIAEEETQFAAMTFFLDDGTAFVCFRGTDQTLVGWKEDFNMSFQDSIPAQREAAAYTLEVAGSYPMLLRLGGHSKGGNLATYAAAVADPVTQQRILQIYNLDGPGFTDTMMGDAGYLAMVPKIRTYIPESSIIGILLEHEEAYSVIKSRQVGILQHEPYSWNIMGGDFVHVQEMSAGSQFADRTIKNWIRDMDKEQRSAFVEAMFQLLSAGGASNVRDLLHPKTIRSFFSTLATNEQARKMLSGEFLEFLRAAVEALPRSDKQG